MSWSSRRAVLFLLALAMLAVATVSVTVQNAQAQAKKKKGKKGGVDLPPAPVLTGKAVYDLGNLELRKDVDDLAEVVQQAIDNTRSKNWREASEIIHGLLGREEDKFVPLTRRGPDGQESTPYISVKREANRLLGAMPKEGRAVYESLYGAP